MAQPLDNVLQASRLRRDDAAVFSSIPKIHLKTPNHFHHRHQHQHRSNPLLTRFPPPQNPPQAPRIPKRRRFLSLQTLAESPGTTGTDHQTPRSGLPLVREAPLQVPQPHQPRSLQRMCLPLAILIHLAFPQIDLVSCFFQSGLRREESVTE